MKSNAIDSLNDENYSTNEEDFSLSECIDTDIKSSMEYNQAYFYCKKSDKYDFYKNEEYHLCNNCGKIICKLCKNLCHNNCDGKNVSHKLKNFDNNYKKGNSYLSMNFSVSEYFSSCQCFHQSDKKSQVYYNGKIPCFISTFISKNIGKSTRIQKFRNSESYLCPFCAINKCSISKNEEIKDYLIFSDWENHDLLRNEDANNFDFKACICEENPHSDLVQIFDCIYDGVRECNKLFLSSKNWGTMDIDQIMEKFKYEFEKHFDYDEMNKILIEKIEIFLFISLMQIEDQKNRGREILFNMLEKLKEKNSNYFSNEDFNFTLSFIFNYYKRNIFDKVILLTGKTLSVSPFNKRYELHNQNRETIMNDLKDLLNIEILEEIINQLINMRYYTIKLDEENRNSPFLITFIKLIFQLYCLDINDLNKIFIKLKEINFKNNDNEYNKLVIRDIDEIFYIQKTYEIDYEVFKSGISIKEKILSKAVSDAEDLDLYLDLVFRKGRCYRVDSEILKVFEKEKYLYFNFFNPNFFIRIYDIKMLDDKEEIKRIKEKIDNEFGLISGKNSKKVKMIEFIEIWHNLQEIFKAHDLFDYIGKMKKNLNEDKFLNEFLENLHQNLKHQKKNKNNKNEFYFIFYDYYYHQQKKDILLNNFEIDKDLKTQIKIMLFYLYQTKYFHSNSDDRIFIRNHTSWKLFLCFFLFNHNNIKFFLEEIRFFEFFMHNKFVDKSFLQFSLENICENLKDDLFYWKYFYIFIKYINNSDEFNYVNGDFLNKFITEILDYFKNKINLDIYDIDNKYFKSGFKENNFYLLFYFLKILKLVLINNNFNSFSPLDFNVNKLKYFEDLNYLTYIIFQEKLDIYQYIESFEDVPTILKMENYKKHAFQFVFREKEKEYEDEDESGNLEEVSHENIINNVHEMDNLTEKLLKSETKNNGDKVKFTNFHHNEFKKFNLVTNKSISLVNVQVKLMDILGNIYLKRDLNLMLNFIFKNFENFENFLIKFKKYEVYFPKRKEKIEKILKSIIKFLVNFTICKMINATNVKIVEDIDFTDKDFEDLSKVENLKLKLKLDFCNKSEKLKSKYTLNKMRIIILDILDCFIKDLIKDNDILFNQSLYQFLILNFSFIIHDYQQKLNENKLNKFITEYYFKFMGNFNKLLEKIISNTSIFEYKNFNNNKEMFEDLVKNLQIIFKKEKFEKIKNLSFYNAEQNVDEYLQDFLFYETKENYSINEQIYNQIKRCNSSKSLLDQENFILKVKKFELFSANNWETIIEKFIKTKNGKFTKNSFIFKSIELNFLQELDNLLYMAKTGNTDFKEDFYKLLNFLNNILYYDTSNLQKILIESIQEKHLELILIMILKINSLNIINSMYDINLKLSSSSKKYFILINFILSISYGVFEGKIVDSFFSELPIHASHKEEINENSKIQKITENQSIIKFSNGFIKEIEDYTKREKFGKEIKDDFPPQRKFYYNSYLKIYFTYEDSDEIDAIIDKNEDIEILNHIYKRFIFNIISTYYNYYMNCFRGKYFKKPQNIFEKIKEHTNTKFNKNSEEGDFENKISNLENMTELLNVIKEKFKILEEFYCEKIEEKQFNNEDIRDLYRLLKSPFKDIHEFWKILIDLDSMSNTDFDTFIVKNNDVLRELSRIEFYYGIIETIKTYFSPNKILNHSKHSNNLSNSSIIEKLNYTPGEKSRNNFYHHTFIQLKQIIDYMNSGIFQDYLIGTDRLILQFLYTVKFLKEGLELNFSNNNNNKSNRMIIDYCFQNIFDVNWVKSSFYKRDSFSLILRKEILNLVIAYIEENDKMNKHFGIFYNIIQRKMDNFTILDEIIKIIKLCSKEKNDDDFFFSYIKDDMIYNKEEFELAELYYILLRRLEIVYENLIKKYIKKNGKEEILKDIYFGENSTHSIFSESDKINEIKYIYKDTTKKLINIEKQPIFSNDEYEKHFKFIMLIGQEIEIRYFKAGQTVKKKIYFFKSPKCFWSTKNLISEFNECATRDSLNSKLHFFNNYIDKLLLSMKISCQEKERIIKYNSLFLCKIFKYFDPSFLNYINFVFVIIINIILLINTYSAAPPDSENFLNKQMYIYDDIPNSDYYNIMEKRFNLIFFQTLFISFIQVILIFVWYIFRYQIEYWLTIHNNGKKNFFFKKYNSLEEYNPESWDNYTKVKGFYYVDLKDYQTDYYSNLCFKMKALLFNKNIISVTLCLLMNISYMITNNKFLLVIQILSIINLNSLFEFFVTAIVSKSKQFVSLLVFIYFIEYIFSWIAFLNLQEYMISDYSLSTQNKITGETASELLCSSAIECFLNTINLGLRNGGGMGDATPRTSFKYDSFKNYSSKLFFDVSFHIVINLILTNIFFGVIVDTFNEFRDEKDKKDNDTNFFCYMCHLNRYDNSGEEDFDVHRKIRHKIQNYIYVIPYLIRKNIRDFSMAEQFIWEQLSLKKVEWLQIHHIE